MPLLFRLLLVLCVSGVWALASDFPAVQLIRTDVQDLYNPENRYGVRYGTALNADAGGSGQESERGSGALPPAPGLNGYKALLSSTNASNPEFRSENSTSSAAGPQANLNQPRISADSGTRPSSITEISTTAILNGWTPESQPQANTGAYVAPFPRYASLQIGTTQSVSPLISTYGPTPTGTVLDRIATAVLNPLQIGAVERPYPTQTPTPTPLVTVSTPNGVTYTLGSSPAVTTIVHTNTDAPNTPPITPDPHLGEAATPEPSSMILALSGLIAGIAVLRRRS